MNGIGIIPTKIRINGRHRIPLDAFRTFTPMGEHQFTNSSLGSIPELEPELTSDEGLGFQEDGPRKPLPAHVVMANLAALRASDDPALQEKGRSFRRHDYDLAVAAYDRWECASDPASPRQRPDPRRGPGRAVHPRRYPALCRLRTPHADGPVRDDSPEQRPAVGVTC